MMKTQLKKYVSKIHLILGLGSGLVVFILGITGAVYCFAPELESLQPYRHVAKSDQRYLPPSQIKEIAEKQLPGKQVQRIYYYRNDKAAMVLLSKKDEYSYFVFINPYSGKVLKIRNNNTDFLFLVLQIHRTLLVPYGHDIIRWSTVIFVILMLSGIILWWPKNRRTSKHGFRVMWRASPKRLNYDLHKVLGFYVTWVAIFTAVTGLMFAFPGFADVVYKITGSNHSFVVKRPPSSDTTVQNTNAATAVDVLWQNPRLDFKQYASLMFVFPATKTGPILLRANPNEKTIYRTDFIYFDQNSGKEIPGAYVWGHYKDARTLSDNIRRMNYDIHTGAILGFPGRVALFFVALIVASLPVTGFLFWYGRMFKRRKKRKDAVYG